MLATENYKKAVEMLNKIMERVSNALYRPKASEQVKAAFETGEGKRYIQSLMNGLIAQNYILNMKFAGKINNEEFEQLLVLASTKQGLEEIAAHTILSGISTHPKFEGINIIQPEVVEDGEEIISDDPHLIEPLDRSEVESETNPLVVKRTKK